MVAATFTTSDYVFGVLAALIVGMSKTALPGAGLIATPLMASVFSGRLIPGGTLPILLLADLFAIRWYRSSTRWDLLRPLAPWVTLGFAGGVTFFALLGAADRSLEIVIGVTILVMVALQIWRKFRRAPDVAPTLAAAAWFGATGGFTTFVSNNAGPIMNTYFIRLGLAKDEMIGTSSWFYFAVNVAKVPVYLALGAWASSGGAFFTADSLRFAAFISPAVVVGVFGGRRVVDRIPRDTFVNIVLALSAAATIKLLAGW